MKARKLKLHRETLVLLEDKALRHAGGGDESTPLSGCNTCVTCVVIQDDIGF